MRWTARAVALSALTVILASCGDDSGEDDEPVELGGDTSTTEPQMDEETEILDAYYAGWEAFDEASDPADPNHPALKQTMTGEALDAATDYLQTMSEAGEHFDGPPVQHSATVRDMTDDRAVVGDCTVSQADHVAADGSVIDPADPTPVPSDAVMVKEDGTWKRSELNIYEEPCEP